MFFQRVVTICTLAIYIGINLIEAKYALSPVTAGVNPQTGARPFRRNILDLQNDAPTWSLYIQALNAVQDTPEDELLSYFQLAGIHGRPYYSWDAYEWNPDAPLIGYCTHGNVLFPTWHRPYLALFERVLADQAQKIAKQYNTPEYQTAADNFRMPYWDWAEVPTMPDVITTPTLTIDTPSGPTTVTNPLYEYKFQQFPLNETWFPGDQDNKLSTYETTKRCPVDGVSNNNQANKNLVGRGLKKNTYDIFEKVTDYNTMSNGGTQGLSFEYVHNLVHVAVGGGFMGVILGHMTAVSYSAFDPIFWLHHTNVDRLLAMWEAVNPDSFLVAENDGTGSFTHPIGVPDTPSDPLTPFTTADGTTAYTSTISRHLKEFGHSYPEIQDWLPGMTPAELKKNVTTWINIHYNPTSPTKSRLRRATSPTKEWSVTIQALGTAMDGEGYIVDVKMSGVKFGEMIVSPPAPAGAAKGAMNATTNFEVGLNTVLSKAGVDTEDVAAVRAFLEMGLEASVTKADTTVVPAPRVAGLVLNVKEILVTPAASITEFPHYGASTLHPEIVKGKAGAA
ncbi:common central domain of tyrosinase-domain-containing protein [Amylocarpus encephaloides]|uniref:Common central domain of tyrosinase-domain-containing protein n=1 Tax=Amylocarpus encephaloides TaxID=45428 RepID=A0A9P7YAX7_9HELO|nr:common central domain of tyrosinase-domain-containing protein [Amylocarpus encephaloides]